MTPEKHALQHAKTRCRTHAEALREALDDLPPTPELLSRLERLDKPTRRVLDQFAYRFTRLQDDMGNLLLPACSRQSC